MTNRKLAKVQRREDHHLAQLRQATTKVGVLRVWTRRLIAEASRASHRDRLGELTLVLVDLVYRLQKKLPLPEPAPGSPATDPQTALRGLPTQGGTANARRDVA